MKLFKWFKSSTPTIDAHLRQLIDRAAQAADPRIRQLPGYEKKLASSVAHAYDYCERVAFAVPGPFYVSRSRFASDPLIHALFASADEIATMFASSQALRDHLAAHPLVPNGVIFALLGMRRSVNAGFGARLAGEIVKRDEPQRTLNFSDHTLAEPSSDLDSLHQRLAETFFDGLLKGFAEQIEAKRQALFAQREELALEKAMLRGQSDPARDQKLAQLQAEITRAGEALMPAALIGELEAMLAHPEERLRLEPARCRIDRMGVIVEGEDAETPADTIRFVELVTRDPRRWVVMCVRLDAAEVQAALTAMSERRRYMVI